MTYQRRPHQKKAVADVLAGFGKHSRGQLIMACGTGKTLTSLWIKEDLNAMRTLVLVPSLALLDQFAMEWRKQQAPDQPYTTLCVCSDSTVGQQADDGYDSVHFTNDDLVHDGFDVTSDPERIAAFMRQGGRQVIFSTYQSSHLIAEAQVDETVPSFDLAIADEAHRCAGDQNSIFATILDGDRIRAEKRLFATATPRIYRLKKGQDTETTIVDMSDEELFGPRFHTLTFGSAIRQELLSDYQVVIMLVDDPEIQSVLKIGGQAAPQETPVEKKDKLLRAAQVGLLKTIREFDLRRVISFHSYVKNASQFAQDLPEVSRAMWADSQHAGLPVADYVSGEMTAQVRKQKLGAFRSTEKGQYRILTNARCLTEGVDVPDIDGIAFIDPRGSHIDIIQALGRAIRKHENKTHGTVILPVYLGKGDSPVEMIENSNFKPVWDVLNALRTHDSEFETALNERRQIEGGATPCGADPFAKIRVIGTEDVIKLSQSLRPILIKELTDRWEVGFGATKAYFDVHGHCNASRETTWPENDSGGFRLGAWLGTQRYAYKQGDLSAHRIERLESIGMVWDQNAAAWEEGFTCAVDYYRLHRHCNAPKGTMWPEGDPDGFRFGNWIQTQRANYKGGKLSADRIARLESIGLLWDPYAALWEEGFAYAVDYYRLNGHCNVPKRIMWPEGDLDGFRLGGWLINQRRKYKQGDLSADRIERLESIGMVWDQNAAAWEEGFAYAKAYYNAHGDCKISQRVTWPEGASYGFRLGIWWNNQREKYKQGGLSKDRIQRLESIGMVWRGRKVSMSEDYDLSDLVDRLKDDEIAEDIPVQMAYFGCDLEQSRQLIFEGRHDEALELLKEVTGDSFPGPKI